MHLETLVRCVFFGVWMPLQFAVNRWDCCSSHCYCYLRSTWRIDLKSQAFSTREKPGVGCSTGSVLQELLVWVICIAHRNLYQLDVYIYAHTFFYAYVFYIWVCVYIYMYGCLLPLYSPLGSSTVFSVPGHIEEVFSVLIAFTARSGHPVDSLNFEALTTSLPISDCTSKGWQWLISALGLFFAWAGSSAWATACPRPHSDAFDHSDFFEACRKEWGCVSRWRSRQHRVGVITSSVENSWESETKPWSFHPTSFDPFGKGCLFPLSFHLSQQNGWAYASPVASGHRATPPQPSRDSLPGLVGVRGREETRQLCTLEPFTITFVADGACLVVLVKSC